MQKSGRCLGTLSIRSFFWSSRPHGNVADEHPITLPALPRDTDVETFLKPRSGHSPLKKSVHIRVKAKISVKNNKVQK